MSTEAREIQKIDYAGIVNLVSTMMAILALLISIYFAFSANQTVSETTILLVQDQMTGNGVVGAVVLLEVVGKEPLDSITDARGFCQFIIPDTFLERPGRIIVEAEGYLQYTQNYNLAVESLPNIIELEPIP